MKQSYSSPELKKWGTVADLTQNEGTFPGDPNNKGST